MKWTLRPAVSGDREWIAELRAVVMRSDLERLGRFDPIRVRERFRVGFDPASTLIVEVDGLARGCIAMRKEQADAWIEHFYLDASVQSCGVGSAVLKHVLEAHAGPLPCRLIVLQHSRARRLYERHGFVVEDEQPIDVVMVRPPGRLT